jgi:hypothetical protein
VGGGAVCACTERARERERKRLMKMEDSTIVDWAQSLFETGNNDDKQGNAKETDQQEK